MISRGNATPANAVINDIRKYVGYFVEDPHLRLGDGDSAHCVLFGELKEYGQVAIKPFVAVGRAHTERLNLGRVSERGFDALRPLQVSEGAVASYLVTERRSGLRHLGQMNWNMNVASRAEINGVIVPTLGQAALTLASWHAERIFHGDAQIKNLAYDSGGSSVYVDAEKTQFSPKGELAEKLAYKDVALFGLSTMARGLLSDRSASYRVGFLNDNLVQPYVETLQAQPANAINTVELAARLDERWELAAKSDWAPRWVRAASSGAAAHP